MTGFAVYDSPFGPIRMDYEGEYLTRLRVVEPTGERGTPTPLTHGTFRQFQEYFAGTRRDFEVPYELRGTTFQKQVWAALAATPWCSAPPHIWRSLPAGTRLVTAPAWRARAV